MNYTLQQLQQIHQILTTTPLALIVSLPLVQTTEVMIAERQRPPAPPPVSPAPPFLSKRLGPVPSPAMRPTPPYGYVEQWAPHDPAFAPMAGSPEGTNETERP